MWIRQSYSTIGRCNIERKWAMRPSANNWTQGGHMRRRGFVTALLVLSFATVVSAQTPTFRLGWEQPGVFTDIQGYKYTLKIDTGTPVAVTPICVARSGAPSPLADCTSPMPALTSGPHTLTLTAWNGFGSASSDPLAGAPPARPVAISITVTVTIP